VDSEEAKQATEAVSASIARTTHVDSRHAGRRSVLSARGKAAGRPTIRTKNVRPPVRSSSLHVTLQTHNRLQTSPCTSRNIKELNTRPSTTRKAREKRKSTRTTTITTITTQPRTSNNNSSRSNASQIKHYCTTSLVTKFTANAQCQRQRHSSSLRTDTRDPCTRESCLILARPMYLREDPTVTIDISTAGKASIKFGKGSVTASVGTAQVSTEIGKINFEVLEAPTPFLLCRADIDRLNIYFNNTTDKLIQGENRTPVIRKWGHPWFHLNKRESATMFLTETELRRLHRRFGHPAVMRLVKLLKNAGHNDFEEKTLEEITKFCYHCQLNSSAPRRFKFTLKDDRYFNYEILVDVMYLGNRPVLYVVDASTAF
jgi:hypothetical protein